MVKIYDTEINGKNYKMVEWLRTEKAPNGTGYVTTSKDVFGIAAADTEHVVFMLNGIESAPVKILHDTEWAWSMRKKQIKSRYSAQDLVIHLAEFDCLLYNAARFYVR